MNDCINCNGHLYGCPYEDKDITECDEKDLTNRMTNLAYKCGVQDAIDKIRDNMTFHQNGLSGFFTISLEEWNALRWD